MIEVSLTGFPSSSFGAFPPTVTPSPSQPAINETGGAQLGAGFYAGIIVAVVLVVFVLVATTLVIATLIQYKNRDNKKWKGNYNSKSLFLDADCTKNQNFLIVLKIVLVA